MGRITHGVVDEGISRLLSNSIHHPWEVPAPLVQTSLSLGKGYLGTTEDSLQLLFHMCHELQEAPVLDGMGSHFSIRP